MSENETSERERGMAQSMHRETVCKVYAIWTARGPTLIMKIIFILQGYWQAFCIWTKSCILANGMPIKDYARTTEVVVKRKYGVKSRIVPTKTQTVRERVFIR